MKKAFLLFLIGSTTLVAQKNILKKFDALRIQIEYLAISNPDSALVYSKKFLCEAKRTKSEQLIANAISSLATVKISRTELDEALQLNNQSFLINTKLKNDNEIALNYFNFGSIYLLKSDEITSLKYILKSLELSKKNKNYLLEQRNNRIISNIKFSQSDFKNALELSLKNLEIQKKHPDLIQLAANYSLIAGCYVPFGEQKKADEYFTKSLLIYKKLNCQYKIGLLLVSWSKGYSYDVLKNLDMRLKAKKIIDSIYSYRPESTNNLAMIAQDYFLIAQSDSLLKLVKNPLIPKTKSLLLFESEKLFKKSIKLLEKQKNLTGVLAFGNLLAELQFYKENYKDAYLNLLENFQKKDSFYSKNNKNKIAKLETQKEIELKNKEIQFNKLLLANKEKQKWFFIIGLFLLTIIGTLLYYQSNNRKKVNEKLSYLNKELDESNKAKTRFFSILNHDLRGPVANLISFLQLQKESPEMLDEESTKRMQDKTMTGAENLLNAMEDILQWSKSQMENFKPQLKKVSIDSLFSDIKIHFASDESIKITFENLDNLELETDANYLKTILRNLTANAIKALSEIENPTIVWKAYKINSQKFLSISDNGFGASQEQFKALYDDKEVVGIQSGLGLHLIRDLAKAINCEINVESKTEIGTKFILKMS